jgi:hypothetical protein
MMRQFRQDQAQRPELFLFARPISESELDAWLRERNLIIPADLKKFWCETGCGEMFESETILSPSGLPALADDIDSVNTFHRQQGMPNNYLIFHTGIGLSIVTIPDGQYASIQEGGSYTIQQTFSSLADWYSGLIRCEYAFRYGLDEP